MTTLLHQEITEQIIGVYYTVYNKLSQTYPEFVYERAMTALLRRGGLNCVRQKEYQVRYKDRGVGLQRLDLLVAGKVVVELKVADQTTALHLAQLLSYLKATGKEVGLLLRFGGPAPEFTRRVLSGPAWSATISPKASRSMERADLLHPELTYQIIGGTLDVFRLLGPGFIRRVYANACYHELKLRGLEVRPRHEFQIFLDELDLGSIKFKHLQVDQRALVFPVTVADMRRIQIANLKAWMRHLDIPLGILVNFKATQFEPVVLRV